MKILGIIPSRYASTRFPGKPLVMIAGKSMIQRVYEQALKAKSLDKVVVATDDARILKHVIEFGGDAVMTADTHQSGTDRCYEAMLKSNCKADYIVNIQGDEPFIKPEIIDDLSHLLDFKTEIATAAKKITDKTLLFDPNVVKVVLTMRKQCLYFSRQAVPYVRGYEPDEWLDHADFHKHIGIYAYRADVLEQISHLPQNPLEKTEKLEQLRWLGYGYKINAIVTEHESIGIDTPENLEYLLKYENLD